MPKQPAQLPAFLTVTEVADQLGVCARTIRRWIDAGELRSHRFGRQVRVSMHDANQFIASARR